jgi:hypothetical protein
MTHVLAVVGKNIKSAVANQNKITRKRQPGFY